MPENNMGLCPSLYGTAVYQSRALYTAVFNQVRVWSDSCAISGSGTRKSNSTSGTVQDDLNQSYQLLPNPNNGNFSLQQSISDDKPVYATIYNELGQCVFKQQLQFTAQSAQINIKGITTGLYMIQLLDYNGHNYTLKFIAQ